MALAPNDLRMGGPLELLDDDGTLFTALYHAASACYHVESRTPVEGHEPLILKRLVDRADATRLRENNFTAGYSIDTAALQLGIDYLRQQIPGELRRFKRGVVVEAELEQIEGFGSF